MHKHYISNNDESPRMFNSNFLDKFSRVHFSIPLLIFVPVIGYFIYQAFVFELSIVQVLLLFATGFATWTFTEYVMHRFVFHYKPGSGFGEKVHFMFHGVHHAYPNDSLRLVMVPPVSIPLAFVFYFLFYFTMGSVLTAPAFAGFVSGYLVYDMTHYAVHHANFKSKWFLQMKKHHLLHHYKDAEHGYGVSSKLWDFIFRSDFKRDIRF